MQYGFMYQLDRDRQGEWVIIYHQDGHEWDEWYRVPELNSFVTLQKAREYRNQFLSTERR